MGLDFDRCYRAVESKATSPQALDEHAKRWRPWRSYAVLHLWASL